VCVCVNICIYIHICIYIVHIHISRVAAPFTVARKAQFHEVPYLSIYIYIYMAQFHEVPYPICAMHTYIYIYIAYVYVPVPCRISCTYHVIFLDDVTSDSVIYFAYIQLVPADMRLEFSKSNSKFRSEAFFSQTAFDPSANDDDCVGIGCWYKG